MNLLKSNLPGKIKIKFLWIYIRKYLRFLYDSIKRILFLVFENSGLLIAILMFIAFVFLVTVFDTKCKYDYIDSKNVIPIENKGLNFAREKMVGTDTVIRFVEKIIYKQVPPKYIFYTRADSILIRDIPKLDVITNFEKDSDGIKIIAVRAADSTIKEYIFENVGPYFSVTSQDGNLFLKARRVWWNGIHIKPEYLLNNFESIKSFDKSLLIGVETDFNIGTKFSLGVNPKYNTGNKDFQLSLFAKIKL